MKINPFLTVLISFILLFSNIGAAAEVNPLNEFKTGSYRQILEKQAGNPFILVIWSIICSSCIKDMALLDELHKKNPQLAFVMLSTDELSDAEDIKGMLEKYHLTDVENWVFADDNAQKLRFEIDPAWYGELPRTYFFDKTHNRTGNSGVLSEQDFAAYIARLPNKD